MGEQGPEEQEQDDQGEDAETDGPEFFPILGEKGDRRSQEGQQLQNRPEAYLADHTGENKRRNARQQEDDCRDDPFRRGNRFVFHDVSFPFLSLFC